MLALEAILFSASNFKFEQNLAVEDQRLTQIESLLSLLPIEAKAYSVYDVTHNVKLYGKNDTVALPLASIAKVMTVAVALSNNSKDVTILLSKEAIKQYGDFGLFPMEKWNINDLAKLTLVSSANDGAYMLSSTSTNFLLQMNTKAKKLGMHNFAFLNPTGLDVDENTAGALASAEDVNLMTVYALLAYPEIFKVTTLPEIKLTSLSGFQHTFKNTDIVVDKIPNLLFSKTGYTAMTGGNLAIIFKNKRGDEIAVTLLGSTFLGRFNDMEKIVNTLYNE